RTHLEVIRVVRQNTVEIVRIPRLDPFFRETYRPFPINHNRSFQCGRVGVTKAARKLRCALYSQRQRALAANRPISRAIASRPAEPSDQAQPATRIEFVSGKASRRND